MENNTQIQDFCRRYFKSVVAPILVDQPDFLQVELPREIDKELTERPFYWMYVEAIGQDVPNTVLSLAFDPDLEIEEVDRMEYVTLGSFRLNKIIESVQKRGRFTRAYLTGSLAAGRRLVPHLLTTFKLSFVADRRRDEMVSYAVNLVSGAVTRDAYELVENLPFASAPSDLSTTVTAAIPPEHGYQRIRAAITEEIQALDHTWAEEAHLHLVQEKEQLETYYESLGLVNQDEVKPDEEKAKKAALYAAERELRIAELEWRCAPRIQIEPFHFALLYLPDDLWSTMASTPKRLSM